MTKISNSWSRSKFSVSESRFISGFIPSQKFARNRLRLREHCENISKNRAGIEANRECSSKLNGWNQSRSTLRKMSVQIKRLTIYQLWKNWKMYDECFFESIYLQLANSLQKVQWVECIRHCRTSGSNTMIPHQHDIILAKSFRHSGAFFNILISVWYSIELLIVCDLVVESRGVLVKH